MQRFRKRRRETLSRLGRSIRIGLVWPAAKRVQQIAANVGAMLVEWIVGREARYEIRRKISAERLWAQRRERFAAIEKDFDRDRVPLSSNERSGHFIQSSPVYLGRRICSTLRDLDVVSFMSSRTSLQLSDPRCRFSWSALIAGCIILRHHPPVRAW